VSVLQVLDLTKRFGALTAVERVSFSLRRDEIMGMIGPNGAGKTTLFNMIVGALRPDGGRVLLNGADITGMRPHRICRLGIAKTSQIVEPFRAMTVFENVLVAAVHGGGMSMAQARVKGEEVLDLVGLSRHRDKLSVSLSVPERRKLELARALATDAGILLLDETLAGLNPHEIDEALELLRRIRLMGKSIVMVEHVMRAVMGVSDRVLVLNYGAVIADGPPGEVADNEEVVDAYLGTKRPGLQEA